MQPLAGFIPMSVRTPEQMGTFGNRVSVMLAELPTDEADPVKRLRRINETMKAVKERHSTLPASLLLDANHFIPPALFAQAARATSRLVGVRGINQPANVMISNVPGPSTPMYLGGVRQRAQFPVSGVLDGIGINITVMSYLDSLEFGIVVDREQLDDPWPILDALRVGLDELRDAREGPCSANLSDLHSPASLDPEEGNLMSGRILDGNSMDDYPLTLTSIVERAERFHADREVVSRRPSGAIDRTTLGACAGRARRLAGALAALGVGEGDPVATLLWNQSEHLELYFAVPAMGAVIHTLNPRLFPDELAFIVDDAEDKVIVVDESLLEVFETFTAARDFAHVIVVSQSGETPAGMLDYESLVAGGEPVAVARAGRTSRGGDVLHLGHDRPTQGGRVLAPRTRAALAGCGTARPAGRISKGHNPSGRPDVPRERVGTALRRSPRRSGSGLPGAASGSRERARPVRCRASHHDSGCPHRVDGDADSA